MDKEEKNEPADSFRIGRIETTIWRNETDKGRAWFNVTFLRKYFDGKREKDSSSFGFEDLMNLQRAADIAFRKVWKLREAEPEPEPDVEEEA